MKPSKKTFVDKAYKLTQNKAPLSFMITSRNTKRKPLLFFDDTTGRNRSLRYAKNQQSPFEDEQDDNVILEPIIFEDGLLFVHKHDQALQEFLLYHPGNGRVYVEIDNEKDATIDVETLDYELEAQILAKDLNLEMLETIGRVVIGLNVDKLTSSELKRDVRLFAKRYSREFIESVNDPLLKLQNSCSKFLGESLLIIKNKKDVYYNLKGNKKKLLTVPYGEDPLFILASFFQSDEGLEVYRLLESKLE
jgi:hypothetical protein